jgi:hypothetical protein
MREDYLSVELAVDNMKTGRIIYSFQQSGHMRRISLDHEIHRILFHVADSLAFTPCYLVVTPTVGCGWEMVCVYIFWGQQWDFFVVVVQRLASAYWKAITECAFSLCVM